MANAGYKKDSEKARNAVYDSHGARPNPFDEGTRLHRLFEKWWRHYHNMEALM